MDVVTMSVKTFVPIRRSIRAIQLVKNKDMIKAASWTSGHIDGGTGEPILMIQNGKFEEPLSVRMGWTIIQGEDGKFGVMLTSVFDEMYEQAPMTPYYQ